MAQAIVDVEFIRTAQCTASRERALGMRSERVRSAATRLSVPDMLVNFVHYNFQSMKLYLS